MSSTDPLEVSIIANIKGLLDGMASATSSVKDASTEMQGSFGSLGKTIENLKAPFLAITAVLAGGKLFGSAVSETVSWNSEVVKLAKTLGITTGQASVLKVELHTLGIDQEVYTSTAQRMVRQIDAGGKGFEKLGLSTKDASGNLKPMPQLMEEAITKIAGMKQGTDQMAAAQMLFGRGAQESMALLKLSADRSAEARIEAEKLNLVVGPDGAAKVIQYQEAMRHLELIQTSLQVQMGNALIPSLASLGAFLGAAGPGAATAMAYAIKGLTDVFWVLYGVVATLAYALDGLWGLVWKGLGGIANSLNALLHGNFNGAWDSLKNGWEGATQSINNGISGISQSWKNAWKGSFDVWKDHPFKDGKVGVGADAKGTADPDKGKDNSQEVLGAFKLQLEEKKAAEENWFTWSTQKELDFWTQKEQLVKKGSKAYSAILTEENKLRRKLGEEQMADDKANTDRLVAKEREGSLGRISILQGEAMQMALVYGAESKQAQEALRKVQEAWRQHAAVLRQIDKLDTDNRRDTALGALDQELGVLQDEESAGLISKQKLIQAEKAFEDQKYEIKLDAARKDAAAEDDPVKFQQALTKIDQMERAHNTRMAELDRQSIAEKRARWTSFFTAMTSGFSSSISGLIKGTMSWGEAFKNILSSALDGLINFFVQWGVQEAIKWATSLAMGDASRFAEAEGAAAVYAINAAGSVAAIPGTGWAAAPGIGAAAYAQGLSWAGMASAAGGWDRVPVDQMAMIHKNEMVLPASLAEGVRQNLGGGDNGRGGDNHFHIHAQIADDSFWQKNQGNILKQIGAAVSNRRKF